MSTANACSFPPLLSMGFDERFALLSVDFCTVGVKCFQPFSDNIIGWMMGTGSLLMRGVATDAVDGPDEEEDEDGSGIIRSGFVSIVSFLAGGGGCCFCCCSLFFNSTGDGCACESIFVAKILLLSFNDFSLVMGSAALVT